MKTLADWLSEAPFTLALSSSFFGFFSHCGIITALEEYGLKPQKITGSSAGALMGGCLASGLKPLDIKEILFTVQKDDFWDPRPGLGLLRGEKFLNLLEKHLTPTFDQAAIPLEVTVLDILTMKTIYLKAGSLPKAVAASCAIPVMFHPVKIDGRFYYDGGVFNKLALQKENIEERIFCVLLESAGISGIYERKVYVKNLSPLHKVVHFKNLPKVNFYSLEGREAAYFEGYYRAKAALSQVTQSTSLFA